MDIKKLKLNDGNPRYIKDAKLKKLCQSIKEFPSMLSLRPIIYDPNTGDILGGNMRYRALVELGYKDIPEEWVKSADKLTDDEKKRFIIEDNLQFGEWDTDILLKEWGRDELESWGLDLPNVRVASKPKEENIQPFNSSHILISFSPEMLMDIEKHIEEIKKITGVEIEYSSN